MFTVSRHWCSFVETRLIYVITLLAVSSFHFFFVLNVGFCSYVVRIFVDHPDSCISFLLFCDQKAETLLLSCPYLLGMASVIPVCFSCVCNGCTFLNKWCRSSIKFILHKSHVVCPSVCLLSQFSFTVPVLDLNSVTL